MTEPVEGEAVEVGHELEVRTPAPVTLFGTDEPEVVLARATQMADALMRVVRSKDLAKQISGREYLLVDAWTLLGSLVGVFPVVVWSRPLEQDGKPHGWEAKVEARTRDGGVVGAAEAQCTRDEKMWGWNPTNKYGKKLEVRDEYALRSMAQTRAMGKALRMPLGFIATMAGFEATPAEEMPDMSAKATDPRDVKIPGGKYAGQTIGEVFAVDRAYIEKIAVESKTQAVKDAAAHVIFDAELPFA